MSITKEQQQALDDALVPREQRLQIGSCNYRLSTTFKPKEPTFQVALDNLATPETSNYSLMSKLIFYLNLGEHLESSSTNVLVEDLVFQIENKESRKTKYMFYPRFIKVIINHFMSQDQSIPRRNKVDWHMANDDPILTTMRFIPQHEVVQKYSAILPDNLTTQVMKESKAYKTYYAFSTGKAIPKPKSGKKKQLVEGLKSLSEIALSEAEQIKLAIERSKTQLQSSQPSGSGVHEGTGVTPGLPDVPTYGSDDEQISWKSSDEEDDDDESNIGKDEDDDDQEDNDDQDNDNDQGDGDERIDSDNDGDDFVHPNDEEIQGANVEGDKQDEEETNKEVEANELYRDVNVNLEGRDIEMTNAQQTNVQPTQVTEDTHVIITAPVNPKGIDSIFNLNTDSTSLVDVPITAIAELPLFLKDLEKKLKPKTKTSSIKLMTLVNDQIKAKVLIRLSTESKTSHAVAANLSELEPKKILIDKMESNKSIHISDEQKNLYKALVDTYESDKLILDTYGDTVSFKRHRDDEDKDEEPFEKTSKTTGNSTEGSKSHYKSAGESAQAEEPMHTAKYLEEPAHQEFETRVTEDQPNEETSQLPDWFQKPAKPLTPNRDWNKTFLDAHGPVQLWLSSLAQMEDPRESFNELMDTPLDFSAFVMNWLKVDTLTLELLTGPTFEMMKGSCKSLVELEYLFEEFYKATTDQLDWNNPEGQQYPHDLRKPLPLIPNSRGHHVIPFDHFIKNDLEYLSGGVSSRKYTTSVTKTKAADYGHIKWIENLVPNRMWSQVSVSYDKYVLWGISHWGRKRQQFYGFAVNREPARDVYSKHRIIVVTKLQIAEWHNYKHLDWITIRRDDDKLYKFKEGDLKRLRIQDIEDMLLLLIQGKLTNLTVKERLTFNFDESDTHVLERLNTSAGNPVNEILLKLNLPDHRILKDGGEVKEFQRSFRHSDTERLSRSDEVLKLKNFKKDATLKLFKSTNQERYEHVGPEVTSSQDGKVYKMAKRDYAWLMISRCSRSHSSQDKETSSNLKSITKYKA
ncbi:hypothetical protein Tco_0222691 [Tanacetum coccineum]